MKRIVTVLCGLLFGMVLHAHAGESSVLSEQGLILELQTGGYVLFIRHFQTDPDQADTDPLDLDNVKAQRQLTDEGRRQAKTVGESFRALKIPVHKVIASRFFRAYETAKLLNVAGVTQSIDVSEGGLVVSPRENQRRAKALRQLLSELPPTGTNTVIVSHRPNLQAAAGIQFGDVSEGETVVFKPLAAAGFEAVARVTWDKWRMFER
ncbi:MAG: histidine phosphatase family protein [Nitrospira sp.]|nr:histidine phosphatase family protein [Nitrospira sp.]